jgi:oligosaccharide repeat unit polymerase
MSRDCLICVLCAFCCAVSSLIDVGLALRLALAALILCTVLWAMLFGRVLAHPAEALLVIWSIPWSFHFLRLLYFSHVWPEAPLIYVAAFLGCYLLGFYVPFLVHSQAAGARDIPPTFLRPGSLTARRRLYDICAMLGFVSAIAAFLSGVANFGANGFSDLAAVRETFTQSTQVSGWAYVVLLSSAGGTVAITMGLLFQEEIGRLRRAAYILSGFATVASAVVEAGRFAALLVALLILICMAVRRKSGLRAIRGRDLGWMLGAIVFALAGYMLVLPSLRDSNGDVGFAEFASRVAGVDMDQGLDAPLSRLPSPVRDAIYGSYVYLAMPIENFRIFYYVYQGKPRYGILEESLISRQISRLFPSLETSTEVLSNRDEEYAAAGEATTSWQTMVRDAVIDFGWAGALVFAWLLGIIGRSVYRRATSSCSVGSILALIGLCFISVHSIMYSIVGDLNILTLLSWGPVLYWTSGKPADTAAKSPVLEPTI